MLSNSLNKRDSITHMNMTPTHRNSDMQQAPFARNVEALLLLQESACALSKIAELHSAIEGCFKTNGKVILCGNGGFAGVSEHVAAELMGKVSIKRQPLPALSLTTDSSVLTCISNDFGFEKVFSRQIEAIGEKSDVLIALSASGSSKNILEALSVSRRKGIRTFLISGERQHNEAIELGASIVSIPSEDTDIIQDVAMSVLHQICKDVESRICSNSASRWDDVVNIAKSHDLQTLILDRDGTVNELVPNNYVITPSQLKISKEFLDYAKVIAETFKYVFIVSNQSCIGKGICSVDAIDAVNQVLIRSISEKGGRVDKIYICPDSDSASCNRKPNIGMADQILQDFPTISFTKALVVGDSFSDELFAQRIGAHFINIQIV